MVLERLWCLVFLLLPTKPLIIVSIQTLFWLSLAKTKWVRELQALFLRVTFRGPYLSKSCLPDFVAETQSPKNLLPCYFLVNSWTEFEGSSPCREIVVACLGLPGPSLMLPLLFLCVSCCFFCHLGACRFPFRRMFLSLFLCRFYSNAGALPSESACIPRALSIWGISTSTAFPLLVGLQGLVAVIWI